jgi:hypothetical protein
MSPRAQQIVNAQVQINRAVYEANQSRPRETYIDECIATAKSDLEKANRVKATCKCGAKLLLVAPGYWRWNRTIEEGEHHGHVPVDKKRTAA